MIEVVEEKMILTVTEPEPIILNFGMEKLALWGKIFGAMANQTDLMTALGGKSDVDHTHDDRYYTEGETDALLGAKADSSDLGALARKDQADWGTDLSNVPASFPPAAHDHDGRYYTEAETDALLAGKSDTGHTHDDRYYTEAETDGLLAGKSDISHDHDGRYLLLHGTADLSGGVVPILLTNENLNDLRPDNTTWYYAAGGNTVTNQPTGVVSFGMVAFRVANGYREQILYSSSGNNVYSRFYGSNTWSEWKKWNLDQLPTASASVLGGIKVGQNLSISDGVLSADASGIVNSVSGNSAVFSDGTDNPVLDFKISIDPIQSGSGTPSLDNVRPISGITGINLSDNGTILPISFPNEAGTVYSGSFDVLTGVLTVDKELVDTSQVTSVTSIATENGCTRFWIAIPNGTGKSCCFPQIISDKLVYDPVDTSITNIGTFYYLTSYQNSLCIKLPTSVVGSTGSSIKAYVNANPISFTRKINTPLTYQLTPQEITTLHGQNTFTADNGTISMSYRADTKLYIDGKFAELQALILEN